MKPIELDSSRQNMKPLPPGLSDDKYLIIALREGYALLEQDDKTKNSVKSDSVKKPTPSKVQDALGKMSDNPYIRSRNTILTKMLPLQRSTIEKMESGIIKKDARYDIFVREVSALGDKLSNLN